MLNHLWIPDIYIYNLVNSRTPTVIGQPMVGTKVWGNKTITMYMHAIHEISCTMEFDAFPFDTQNCTYYLSSPTHTANEITFGLRAIHMKAKIQSMPEFHVQLTELEPKDKTTVSLVTGIYSNTGIQIQLHRKIDSYILKHFLPCFGMVLASWIGFLIPLESIPGRVGLLVTLFLVMTTLFGDVQVEFFHLSIIITGPQVYIAKSN